MTTRAQDGMIETMAEHYGSVVVMPLADTEAVLAVPCRRAVQVGSAVFVPADVGEGSGVVSVARAATAREVERAQDLARRMAHEVRCTLDEAVDLTRSP